MEADAFTRQETGSRVVRGILTNAYALLNIKSSEDKMFHLE